MNQLYIYINITEAGLRLCVELEFTVFEEKKARLRTGDGQKLEVSAFEADEIIQIIRLYRLSLQNVISLHDIFVFIEEDVVCSLKSQ